MANNFALREMKLNNGMVDSLNINLLPKEACHDAMMLKTKRMLTASSKRNSATGQKLPFLIRQRKDRIKEMETEFSQSFPPGPPKTQSFFRSSFRNEHFSSASNNDPESFHCAIGPVLVLAQFFGVLPVSGVLRPTPLKMKFVKFSFLTFYAASITATVLVMAILSIIHMIRTLNAKTFAVKGGIAAAMSGAMFYGNCMMGLILFFWLSPRWVTLQRDWRSMEQFIDSNKMQRPKLRWRLYAISSTILFLAVIEHILSIAVNAEKHDYKKGSENATFQDFLQIYCENSHAFILDTVAYNFALGMLIFIVSKLATFTWNFTDVFVMMVATGLAERYKMLNKDVMNSTSKHRNAIDWSGYREDYAALSCMVKKVDSDIAPIILLSFANNLYFICLQLLNGLSKSENSILDNVYFFGSFIFLVGRTVTVTLLTSRINDQSKLVLPALYNCSASTYNVETERLIYLLTTDEIALTGLRFFSITRNFMLANAFTKYTCRWLVQL
ncbi:gustatory receptor for sugar taste 64f isoform X2 [Ooceraea biroi]|uniref:gustatory receptor for sugar taste 64f isoform X2 n=1 Tax=Ooceraea biroi TaxID=2015173 RepID=UPI0005B8C473|nr:gustatory receptor for sugar taste 64f isoform X2 [Ooceraea biroi]